MNPKLLTVEEAGAALGVSRATVWRMIQRKQLASVRQRGRRLISRHSIVLARSRPRVPEYPPFTRDNYMIRMAGAFRGGDDGPGSEDKHAVLDD